MFTKTNDQSVNVPFVFAEFNQFAISNNLDTLKGGGITRDESDFNGAHVNF